MNDNNITATIPISVGELVDKITILSIKNERIDDAEKKVHVQHELSLLQNCLTKCNVDTTVVTVLKNNLYNVNIELWNIEDALRKCETR